MPDKIEKSNAVSCRLRLARYWGMCGETVIIAADILRNNPTATLEDALKTGFKRSSETLLPCG